MYGVTQSSGFLYPVRGVGGTYLQRMVLFILGAYVMMGLVAF